MIDVLIVILMVIICIGLVIAITTFMTKRAMHQVIRIMRLNGAVDAQGAKTVHELRLNPPALRERLMKMRDYKPKALELLFNLKIVDHTEDGRVFLDEQKLLASPLVQRWPSLARGIEPRQPENPSALQGH